MVDTMKNCGRRSETVVMRFHEIKSGPRILENMLSISVLELLFTLAGYITCGKNI